MKHLEFLLIPVFMYVNYLLSVASRAESEKKYGKHITFETPAARTPLQRAIAERRWFNPRYVLPGLAAAAILLLLANLGFPESLIQAAAGVVFMIVAAHLGTYLLSLTASRYAIARPQEISGQVVMSQRIAVLLTIGPALTLLVPLALIAVFAPSPFVFGGLSGVVVLLVVTLLQLRRVRAPDWAGEEEHPPPTGTA